MHFILGALRDNNNELLCCVENSVDSNEFAT